MILVQTADVELECIHSQVIRKKQNALHFALFKKNGNIIMVHVLDMGLLYNFVSVGTKDGCQGVANVRYQRAKKSFTLKYNPDFKWSHSLYKLLNQRQSYGEHITLLNRDDRAGFRLDSTYTHKSQPALSIKPTATTRTDFTNKYAAQLQVTSYNFSKTATSDEICIGVVKATGLHEKNPSQHAADLQRVEELGVVKQLISSTALVHYGAQHLRTTMNDQDGKSLDAPTKRFRVPQQGQILLQ